MQENEMIARNAGSPTLSVWQDGSFVVHGRRDAEYAALSEPEAVILTLDLETHNAITFRPAQARVDLAEKLFGTAAQRHCYD